MGLPPVGFPAGSARAIWLFDLDNTLHDAGSSVFGDLNQAMTAFIERELSLDRDAADALRRHYWLRYGATLLGLTRHHGVKAAHFLAETHRLPRLEERLVCHGHDRVALRALPGRKIVLTNAPLAYAERVLKALGLLRDFDAVVAIEQMSMFGRLRPKPDARMLRALTVRLRVPAGRCVLVEDTLQHQKAAHALGMRTVWMQRWLRGGARLARRPRFVDRRVRSLAALRRLPLRG